MPHNILLLTRITTIIITPIRHDSDEFCTCTGKIFWTDTGKNFLMLSRVVSKAFGRSFGVAVSKVLPGVQTMNDKFTLKALEMYKSNKVDVDKELDKV